MAKARQNLNQGHNILLIWQYDKGRYNGVEVLLNKVLNEEVKHFERLSGTRFSINIRRIDGILHVLFKLTKKTTEEKERRAQERLLGLQKECWAVGERKKRIHNLILLKWNVINGRYSSYKIGNNGMMLMSSSSDDDTNTVKFSFPQ